jgi:hypothetical protein
VQSLGFRINDHALHVVKGKGSRNEGLALRDWIWGFTFSPVGHVQQHGGSGDGIHVGMPVQTSRVQG